MFCILDSRKIAFTVFLVLTLGTQTASAEVWREGSYKDFVDGSFEDGGANTYVSANGRIQTINRWDLNSDGHIDIPVANTHPLIEAMDMSIYWGNGTLNPFDLGEGFERKLRVFFNRFRKAPTWVSASLPLDRLLW